MHCALAPSLSCITPFTFPNPVLEPLLVPTLPVIFEIPVFVTAPTLEKRTNPAAVPSGGAWAKFTMGIVNNNITANALISCVFIVSLLNCE